MLRTDTFSRKGRRGEERSCNSTISPSKLDADGIATAVTWDMPGQIDERHRPPTVMADLDTVIDHVTVADAAIKGCVITSGKDSLLGRRRSDHASGPWHGEYIAKLDENARVKKPAMQFLLRQLPRKPQRSIYRKLETCGKALRGSREWHLPWRRVRASALLSLTGSLSDDAIKRALACRKSRSGYFPGAGGTQRVARLMQTGDALQMLFKGEQIKAAAAKGMNLVHAVDQARGPDDLRTPRPGSRAAATAKAPWDVGGLQDPLQQACIPPLACMIWPPAPTRFIARRETHG